MAARADAHATIRNSGRPCMHPLAQRTQYRRNKAIPSAWCTHTRVALVAWRVGDHPRVALARVALVACISVTCTLQAHSRRPPLALLVPSHERRAPLAHRDPCTPQSPLHARPAPVPAAPRRRSQRRRHGPGLRRIDAIQALVAHRRFKPWSPTHPSHKIDIAHLGVQATRALDPWPKLQGRCAWPQRGTIRALIQHTMIQTPTCPPPCPPRHVPRCMLSSMLICVTSSRRHSSRVSLHPAPAVPPAPRWDKVSCHTAAVLPHSPRRQPRRAPSPPPSAPSRSCCLSTRRQPRHIPTLFFLATPRFSHRLSPQFGCKPPLRDPSRILTSTCGATG